MNQKLEEQDGGTVRQGERLQLNDNVLDLLNLCLKRTKDSVLQLLHDEKDIYRRNLIENVALLMPESQRLDLVKGWLTDLSKDAVRLTGRGYGLVIALCAVHGALGEHQQEKQSIVNTVVHCCGPEHEIEMRVIALQAVKWLWIPGYQSPRTSMPVDMSPEQVSKIGKAINAGLNDYTITERGDVGSLVRIQALETLRSAWSRKVNLLYQKVGAGGPDQENLLSSVLYGSAVRLSLEKLDKVRDRANDCLWSRYQPKELVYAFPPLLHVC